MQNSVVKGALHTIMFIALPTFKWFLSGIPAIESSPLSICIISPTQNLSMEDNSSKLSDSFVTRSISLDTNHPPSVPLVIAKRSSQSEECAGGVQDDELILEIVPESLELLRKLEKPVAPVAICGPYRTGKSYFLSRIVGDSECFKVAHSTEPCTRGIWMATIVLECPEFIVVFFDTEGIDAVDTSKQGSINFMISIALTSSLVIYNTKRPLQFKDIEKLRYVFHAV